MVNSTRKAFVRASLAGVVALGSALAYTAVAAQDGGSTFRATLGELNDSGAQGEATLRLSGRNLHVHISATGLEAGGVHLGHIHGMSSSNRPVDSTCPTGTADTDGDGFIEFAEGLPNYGPVVVNFNNVDADLNGTVDFTTTITLSGQEATMPLNKRVIVLHGMTVGAIGTGTPGEVNGTAGYKTALPVLCGVVSNAPNDTGSDALRFRTPPRN
jgi:hypothetical protein